MRDDYKLQGTTAKLEVEIEQKTVELLKQMAAYSKLTPGEITNTALKRFIAAHNDFFPPRAK